MTGFSGHHGKEQTAMTGFSVVPSMRRLTSDRLDPSNEMMTSRSNDEIRKSGVAHMTR